MGETLAWLRTPLKEGEPNVLVVDSQILEQIKETESYIEKYNWLDGLIQTLMELFINEKKRAKG